ncbi:hypothetical protein Droror1_Dr00024504 [Drosera rotundifolia]
MSFSQVRSEGTEGEIGGKVRADSDPCRSSSRVPCPPKPHRVRRREPDPELALSEANLGVFLLVVYRTLKLRASKLSKGECWNFMRLFFNCCEFPMLALGYISSREVKQDRGVPGLTCGLGIIARGQGLVVVMVTKCAYSKELKN